MPARWKLTISGNLPPNNVKAHVESAGARRRERFSADERGRRRKACIECDGGGHDDFSEEGEATAADSEEHGHRSSKPATGDERAGDERVEESSEEEMQGGPTE